MGWKLSLCKSAFHKNKSLKFVQTKNLKTNHLFIHLKRKQKKEGKGQGKGGGQTRGVLFTDSLPCYGPGEKPGARNSMLGTRCIIRKLDCNEQPEIQSVFWLPMLHTEA